MHRQVHFPVCLYLFLEAIGTRNGVFKERNVRRHKSENRKQNRDQANPCDRQLCADGAGKVALKMLCFHPKHHTGGKEEDSNIEPICLFAQNAGVGVIYYWNQHESNQYPRKFDTPKGRNILTPKIVFHQGNYNHWVEKQFQMLPDGFIYCREECHNCVAACPIEQKM